MVSTSEWRDFQAGPFIEDWLFVDHDAAVIIRSRGRHGPSHIHKFSLKTGRLIDHAKGSGRYEDTPEWAKCGPHVLAADARVIPSLSQRLSREQHHAIRGLEWQQAGELGVEIDAVADVAHHEKRRAALGDGERGDVA
jgi:hypothetical protein